MRTGFPHKAVVRGQGLGVSKPGGGSHQARVRGGGAAVGTGLGKFAAPASGAEARGDVGVGDGDGPEFDSFDRESLDGAAIELEAADFLSEGWRVTDAGGGLAFAELLLVDRSIEGFIECGMVDGRHRVRQVA